MTVAVVFLGYVCQKYIQMMEMMNSFYEIVDQ